ncbi:prolyl oligopeptidase family serine peptidase [Cognataquiflexum rubidum]|uniref:S9 family peptidase n=1 Tax=Cognataquiflexum rubidum TaxID=2922273 RepID=UPI001F13E527|nr:prolyl oligopeptidase family serine peptidase [Cognataquiflexum rubidum]MCH6234243.1 prolyl oligopeptidase family serine peptidase [Cognataquiflexum rubidum]
MKTQIKFHLFILLFWSSTFAIAQEKRALTHQDYDGWETVSSEKISKSGQWIGYTVNPQDGDGRLEIVSHQNQDQRFLLPRVNQWTFCHNSQFAIGKIYPQADTVKNLKLKKKKADDMPKDSVFVMNLTTGELEKLARVKSYSIPAKEGNWMAIHFEKDLPKKAEKKENGDTTKVNGPKPEKPKKTDGSKLMVKDLAGTQIYEFDRVKSFGFSEKGDFLYYTKASEDTLKNAGIFLFNLKTGESKTIDEGKTDYISMVFSPENKLLAFLATEDSTKSKKPYFDLFLFDINKEKNQKIASKGTAGINGMVSKNGRLFFSNDENRLFFGTSPDYIAYQYEDDSTILDEERVSLDIWGWQDAEIQPMQLKNKSREENKSFLTVFNLKSKIITQIGDESVSQIDVDKKVKNQFGLGFDASPYRRNYSWDIQIGRDLYLVDLTTGSKSLIRKDVPDNPQLSPEGKYVFWYDERDSSWVSYDIKSKTFKNLTQDIESIFYDELHDSPALPSSNGAAGWTKGDLAFLVYDRYDIWKIDPTGKSAPVNVTKGEGKKQQIVFRREKLDNEEESIDPSQPLILNAFNELNKKNGFFKGDISGATIPQSIVFTDHRYSSLTKAENSDKMLVRRSTFQEYSDIYATDLNLKSMEQVSHANPQQSQVKWGSVELVNYLANDGVPLQGLLFKPDNFDPKKKYPMLVYFYERNSDGLHSYRAPAPSASTINIPYFVSNDYLVFVPDIKYDLGLPGPSAYNCIIPGVQALVSRGFVDASNMAIQGQSWGGYQVAYLITRTNMFKAAGAGAPVVNMTSAYGGIRWGTGMSRMFQYEQTQSRIGGTLWDKPLYYIENSPLFTMDRVNTPVLIMHNDDDGSVPWYQGIEMFMALKRLNKPAWLLQYNGEDHNLRLRKNRKDLSIRMAQFFDYYLKGAPAPLWMTEGLPAVEKGKTLKYELSGN